MAKAKNKGFLRGCAGPVAPRIERLEDRRLLSATGTIGGIPVSPPPPVPAFSASTLVAGPDGNIWFTDQDNNAIGRETPGGMVAEFPLPTDQAGPDQIVSGPDGNLWFIESDVSQIAKITTAGKVTEFAMPSPDSSPSALTAGPGGLWFVDSGNNEIGQIAAVGKIHEFSIDPNLTLVGGIVAGPDGNLWTPVQDDSGNSLLARMTPAGKVATFSLPDYPNDLTVGPDGNFWIGCDGAIDRMTTGGVVTSFPIPSGDGAVNITGGPDGALWFDTYGSNAMGRVTTSGSVIEFDPPGLGQYDFVNDLTSGPGNKIWYATDNGAINSFDPQNVLLAGGTDATATAGSSATITVASFVDLASGTTASAYSATIDWGDGTTSAGTIAANSQGGFDVSGTHTFGIGSSNIVVTITDIRTSPGLGGRTAIAYSTVTSPAPPTQGTGVNINATAGQLFNGVVAHYTGVILSSLSSYSANIDWGDGHFTGGTITADGRGGVEISGSNRYAQSGSYTVTTNLWPWSFGPILPIMGGVGRGVATTGKVVGVPVKAVGILAAGAASAGGTITTPGGTIIPEPPIPDPFPLPAPNGTTSTAAVAQGVMNGTGYTLLASSSQTFSNVVATFKPTDPNADLSHFHATVKWSDPGTFDWFTLPAPDITNAPITPDGQGGFTVSVNTNLPQYGWYHYQVLISDDRISTPGDPIVGAAYGQVIIDTPIRPIPLAGGVMANGAGAVNTASGNASATPDPAFSEHVKFSQTPIRRRAHSVFNGNVGILSGLVGNASQLQGTINWGDGTSSPALFKAGKKGRIHVRGKHTYVSGGNDTISISLTQAVANLKTPAIRLPLEKVSARITAGHHGKHRASRDRTERG